MAKNQSREYPEHNPAAPARPAQPTRAEREQRGRNQIQDHARRALQQGKKK